jgi:Ca2+-binding RTX toxin-like protein
MLLLANWGGQCPLLACPIIGKGVLLMLRMVVLLGGALLVGVILLGGVALAKDIRGTFGKDNLEGTNQLDRIYGLGAADTIMGLGGNDDCYGGSGADEIRYAAGNDRIDGGFGVNQLFGGTGNDRIIATDGRVDRVNCGTGDDTAYIDPDDLVEPAQDQICEHIFVATEQTGP